MSEGAATAGRSIPEEGFEDLYENAPCGYLSMFPDGHIFKANGTLARWMGLDPQALAGSRFRNLLTLPGRIVYETHLAPLFQGRAPFEGVILDLLMGSGDKLPVIVSGVWRLDAGSGEAFVRLTLIRATDRRHYERELLASREAAQMEAGQSRRLLADVEEMSALREEFIAVLGHDLRNPLASIVGAARLLRKQPQTERALDLLGLMERSVARAGALIDDVLDFARGRLGGGLHIDRTRTASIEPALRQVIAEIAASYPDRIIEADLSLDEPVNFDQTRIGQLASNLLGNAITHGDPRQPVRISGSIEGGVFEFWVANSGEPITQKGMERLFHPFFRGEVRASQQGLGLGLYIASEIAAAHGGELTVNSTAQETRFTLRIPVA